MNIAKLYFDKEMSITITEDTLINDMAIDSKRPDLDIKKLVGLEEIVEISNSKHTYFFNTSQVKFIKMSKPK